MYVYTWFRLAQCLPLSRRLKRGCNSCPFLLRSLSLRGLQVMLGCLANYSCLTICGLGQFVVSTLCFPIIVDLKHSVFASEPAERRREAGEAAAL